MKKYGLPSIVFGLLVMSTCEAFASAQITEQIAREHARNAVLSQLRLEPGHFLQVQRNEELEQQLAVIVAKPTWSEFIYSISQAGDEIKEDAIVHHIFTDVDLTYTVAVSPSDGSTYRIQGFKDSLAEFGKLISVAKVRVTSLEQAQAVSDFYRDVNPERNSLTPISSLIALKQAAELQCLNRTTSFDAGEKGFSLWWKKAKPLYLKMRFKKTAVLSTNGYFVDWIVLSSPAGGNCGGAPLRARLEVGSNGDLGKISLSPVGKDLK